MLVWEIQQLFLKLHFLLQKVILEIFKSQYDLYLR